MERSIVGGRYCTCRQMNVNELHRESIGDLDDVMSGVGMQAFAMVCEQVGVDGGRRRAGVPLIIGKVLEDAYKRTEGIAVSKPMDITIPPGKLKYRVA